MRRGLIAVPIRKFYNEPICCFCDKKLRWNSDFDAEDCGYEEDGIVSFYSCDRCEIDYEIYVSFGGEDDTA